MNALIEKLPKRASEDGYIVAFRYGRDSYADNNWIGTNTVNKEKEKGWRVAKNQEGSLVAVDEGNALRW